METYSKIIATRNDSSKDWIKRRDLIKPLIDLGTSEALQLVYDLLLNDPNSLVYALIKVS